MNATIGITLSEILALQSIYIGRTIYWHQPIVFSEFQGFQAKQMRLREVGSNLGTHMDRSSAKLTVLYYPNEVWEGGELVYASIQKSFETG